MPEYKGRAEEGAVAVELAVLLPVLALILFGTIQFGVALSKTEIYENAAREGARYAATHCRPQSATGCTNTLIANRIDSSIPNAYPFSSSSLNSEVLDPSTGSPSGKESCDSSTFGWQVRVYWTQNLGDINVPFFKNFTVNRPIEGVFRCEA
jgi:Flp pilus assembly protein TadG